jgi:hypothetical protein
MNLKKFDMTTVKAPSVSVFIGPRAVGKTTAINDCLRHHDIPNGLKIDKEYSKETVKTFVENQKNSRAPAHLVLDACFYDSKWTKDPAIKSIFMNGRHYNIFTLIGMCYPMLPVNYRVSCDYVFISKTDSAVERERLYESYGGNFKSLEEFNTAMDTLKEHEFLVLNKSPKTVEDIVSIYKAD